MRFEPETRRGSGWQETNRAHRSPAVDCAAMAEGESGAGRDRQPLEIAVQQARFVYGDLRAKLDAQLEAADRLDRKLGTSIGLSGAMITLFVAAIVAVYGATGSADFLADLAVMIAVTGSFFLANLVVTIYAYGFLSEWNDAPEAGELVRRGVEGGLVELIDWASEAVRSAISANQPALAAKHALTLISLVLAGSTAASVVISAIVASFA